MTSSDTKTQEKMHRVQIVGISESHNATQWCTALLFEDEWESEVFDNFDCFYFTSKSICSMFMFVNGGKYIPPPRGFKNE
jgi:hypothetical protein